MQQNESEQSFRQKKKQQHQFSNQIQAQTEIKTLNSLMSIGADVFIPSKTKKWQTDLNYSNLLKLFVAQQGL